MDYLEIAKMAMKKDIPLIISDAIIKPIVISEPTINKPKSIIQSKKLDITLMAEKLVEGIKDYALSIGWTLSQLEKLTKIVASFIPCSLKVVGTQSININMVHSDGSIRGSVVFRK